MKKTIQEAVAEKLTNAGTVVTDTVVSKIAQIEIDKRVDIITKGLNKISSIESDIKRIDRDDIVTYQSGTQSTSMSKQRYDDIEKLKQKLGELTKDVDTALESNTQDSYNKLSDKLKKLDGGTKEADKPEDK